MTRVELGGLATGSGMSQTSGEGIPGGGWCNDGLFIVRVWVFAVFFCGMGWLGKYGKAEGNVWVSSMTSRTSLPAESGSLDRRSSSAGGLVVWSNKRGERVVLYMLSVKHDRLFFVFCFLTATRPSTINRECV